MVKSKNSKKNTILLGIVFVIVFSGVVAVTQLLFKNVRIDGVSMEPTLDDGDFMMFERWSYHLGNPKKGDIIIFPDEKNPTHFYVKRVIGLPGDQFDFSYGYFYLNGEKLEDDFSAEEIHFSQPTIEFPMIVPQDSYFVLGDNRQYSSDSRKKTMGCIPKERIIGKTFMRSWPPLKIGFIF